jgi:hypothetical protein
MKFLHRVCRLIGIETKAEKEAKATAAAAQKRLQDEYGLRRRIAKFPPIEMTKEEHAKLKASSIGINLNTCQLGTWFACKPDELAPDLIVVGEVVARKDLFTAQLGAASAVPERGINRYRVQFTDPPSS